MTKDEFSNRFDVLYNNITSSAAPGLDEYEKSVFATKAQLEKVKNSLNPKGNKYGEGFDHSAKRQIEFSTLVRKVELKRGNSAEFCRDAAAFDLLYTTEVSDGNGGMQTVDVEPKILAIVNEYLDYTDNGNTYRLVGVPISNVEYDTLMSRPYKLPPKAQAWRLFVNGHFEVISAFKDSSNISYHIRYVKVPDDIDLTVNTTDQCSELPEAVHEEILQRAVELAKAAYVADGNQQQILQTLGERSE